MANCHVCRPFVHSRLVESLECAVCFEIFRDPVILHCGHSFCRGCVAELFQGTAANCPSCRQVIPPWSFVPNLALQGLIADPSVMRCIEATEDLRDHKCLHDADLGGLQERISDAESELETRTSKFQEEVQRLNAQIAEKTIDLLTINEELRVLEMDSERRLMSLEHELEKCRRQKDTEKAKMMEQLLKKEAKYLKWKQAALAGREDLERIKQEFQMRKKRLHDESGGSSRKDIRRK